MKRETPGIRATLLDATLWFLPRVIVVPGVHRVALVGSIVTDRANPKDIDLLVTVSAEADLVPLATLARQLKGRLQSHNRTADIFLADERGRYIGRTCSWVRCGPGIRASCDALHCGQRSHLHDDLATVRLDDGLVASPPIELWPVVIRRVRVPADVERLIARFHEPHNHGVHPTACAVGEQPTATGVFGARRG